MSALPVVEKELKKIGGNLISIVRDIENGWYYLEIGIPKTWVYNSNKDVKCTIAQELDGGDIIKIEPKRKQVIIDDLFLFVQKIIQTNEQITKRENEFKEKMENMKKRLEKDAEKFYEELEDLKKTAFEQIDDNTVSVEEETDEPVVKTITQKKRGRPPKKKIG